MAGSAAVVLVSAYEGEQNRQAGEDATNKQQAMNDRALAEQQKVDAQKQQYVQDMLNNAKFTNTDYIDAANNASNDVNRSFDAARGTTERNLERMGINPNSGRWLGAQRGLTLGQAAADANAQTNARLTLRQQQRNLTNQAYMAGLGVNPGAPGMMLQEANTYGNQAAQYNQSAQDAISAGLSTIGTIRGMKTPPPAVNSQPASTTGAPTGVTMTPTSTAPTTLGTSPNQGLYSIKNPNQDFSFLNA